MKKFGMLAVLFVSVLFISGCGGKKLVCTNSTDEMKAKITFNLKDDKATSLKEEYTFQSKETADAFCSLIKLGKSSSSELSDMKISCSGKKVSVSTKSVKEYYETADVEELTESLEEEGYTCK